MCICIRHYKYDSNLLIVLNTYCNITDKNKTNKKIENAKIEHTQLNLRDLKIIIIFGLHLVTVVFYLHTYINGHYNRSVRIIDLVSHTIYVVCVNFIHYSTYSCLLLHAYIIGHYNPSVRIIDLVSHTIYVVCVNFIHHTYYFPFPFRLTPPTIRNIRYII